MGAIIKLFTGIIKGIIGFVTGLFGGGKKSKDGFFLEVEPAAEGAPVDPSAVMVAEVAETSEQQQEGGVSKKAAKTAKGTKGGKVAATAAVAAVAASVTATPKMPDPTEIIQAALAASQRQLGQQAQAGSGVSFAEMNAVPISTGGRRRPGANMTGFLDMAKTMRTSR